MPKLTGPMMSMGASGQIGKTLVFAKWKGVAYARQHVVPANPRTTKQVNNRAIWALIGQAWLYAPSAVQAAFNGFSTGKALTGRNKFFSDNQSLLAIQPTPANIAGFTMSPGNNGGLPPNTLVVTPGDGTLTLSATMPGIPAGWSITKVHGAALINQDPTDAFAAVWYYASDDAAPYSVEITGLTNGTEYAVGLWIEWLRADGKTAYSVSIAGLGTPAA